MRDIFKFAVLAAVAALAVCSCKNEGKKTETLLRTVNGAAGEVVVVIKKDLWEGNLGGTVRGILAKDFPYLPQPEPTFTLINVAPSGFNDLFKYHRNILMFNVDSTITESGVVYRNDVWAKPQTTIQINAASADSAAAVFSREGETISAVIEQAERDRWMTNALEYEDKVVAEALAMEYGFELHFPSGYKVLKMLDDFLWIADEKQYTTQGVFMYKYPATEDEDPFSRENMIAKRNAFLKAYVPGMFENTYMITGEYITPGVKFMKYHGREFVEMRGLWEVQNDFMGGPFVSHSFYSQDGKEIIVLEAWVYAAKYEKRRYLRQVESILYSFDWAEPSAEKPEASETAPAATEE